ncbi:MAG: hypothetical protein AAB421_05240 [Patescibacteria group bacterium]
MAKKRILAHAPSPFLRVLLEIEEFPDDMLVAAGKQLTAPQPGDHISGPLPTYVQRVVALMGKKGFIQEAAREREDFVMVAAMTVDTNFLYALLEFFIEHAATPANLRGKTVTWAIRRGFILVFYEDEEGDAGDDDELSFEPDLGSDADDNGDEPAPKRRTLH